MNREIKQFKNGIHNVSPDTEIPSDAASSAYNWITQDGRIKLAGGRQMIGDAGTVGRINALHTGYTTKGVKVLYRKTETKLQYLLGSTWTDILTGLTNTEFACANYSSLAGAFTLFNGVDGFYLINNANPGSAVDIYDSAKNFKGYILIDRGRTILWNRDKDKTGLYGSKIDRQNSTTYNTVTGEAAGSSGSTHYTGTLAFKASGSKRISFAVSFTATISGGSETFTDNYDGTLTSDHAGTGTINYATGAYDITFAHTTTGAVTTTYQWQDFTIAGIADFTKSATRLAGEGFQFPQDEGGDEILNILIGQDGAYYSLKRNSAYRLSLDAADTNAENLVYRKDMGLTYWRTAVSTSKGIMFINQSNPLDPKLTILRKNDLGDSIEPYLLCTSFNFANYEYDDSAMDTYDRYVIISCKTIGADANNVILMCNPIDNSVDVVKYEARMFAKDDIKLYVGSPISQDVYQILVGFDDQDLAIQNAWESKAENWGSQYLKKEKRLRFKGLIDPDQNLDIYINTDDSGYSLLTSIDGNANYVDYSTPQAIGYNFIGGSQLGGDDITNAYPFFCELRVKITKFNKRKLKFVATGIGYVDINYQMDWDILVFEDRIPKKYRTKRISALVISVFGPGTSLAGVTYDPNGMWAMFGPNNVDGSWMLIVDGNDFKLQRLESGVWVDKQEYTP